MNPSPSLPKCAIGLEDRGWFIEKRKSKQSLHYLVAADGFVGGNRKTPPFNHMHGKNNNWIFHFDDAYIKSFYTLYRMLLKLKMQLPTPPSTSILPNIPRPVLPAAGLCKTSFYYVQFTLSMCECMYSAACTWEVLLPTTTRASHLSPSFSWVVMSDRLWKLSMYRLKFLELILLRISLLYSSRALSLSSLPSS